MKYGNVSPRVFFLLLVFLLVIGFFIGTRLAAEGNAGPVLPTILIDPGHGGIDGGCGGSNGVILEKALNLAVGQRLRFHLHRYGVSTVMTRVDDNRLGTNHRRDLLARVEMARSSGINLVVSLHGDWTRSKNRKGPRVFYPRDSEPAESLAVRVQNELNCLAGVDNIPLPVKSLIVIREAKKPAILIELGFLSHPEERIRLASVEYQDALAEAIAVGVVGFLLRWPLT